MCSSWVPLRYTFVEVTTAVAFLVLWSLFKEDVLLFLVHAVLAAILIVIAVYDVRHYIIPNETVLGVTLVAAALLGFGGLSSSFSGAVSALLSGIGAFIFFGGLWFISKGKWLGFGDAKLAFPLGVIVGFPAVFSMVILSFWIGAVVSLFLLALQRFVNRGKHRLPFLSNHLTIKSEVPFAPFLIAAFVLVEYFNANIFDITTWFFWTM